MTITAVELTKNLCVEKKKKALYSAIGGTTFPGQLQLGVGRQAVNGFLT